MRFSAIGCCHRTSSSSCGGAASQRSVESSRANWPADGGQTLTPVALPLFKGNPGATERIPISDYGPELKVCRLDTHCVIEGVRIGKQRLDCGLVAIPDYQSLMRPLLAAVADGSPHRVRDLVAVIADDFHLSEEERKQLLPSGTQRVIDNRVFWATTYLRKAGLLSTPQRGFIEITPTGRAVLQKNPKRVDVSVLMQFPSFQAFRSKPKAEAGSKSTVTGLGDVATPEETLEATWFSLKKSLAEEVLGKVRDSSPKFFERLVLDLLVRMGYGGSFADAATMLGTSGDEGVDGVIKEDKLGLDVVYVQAKRWGNQVGRPQVQAFAGSLEGQRARKGVMITTSTFSSDAKAYVEKIEKRIVLIDGQRLVELMIEHNVGTATARTYEVKRIDNDYFDDGPLTGE